MLAWQLSLGRHAEPSALWQSQLQKAQPTASNQRKSWKHSFRDLPWILPAQSLAINTSNTWQESSSCQGGLQRGPGSSVGTCVWRLCCPPIPEVNSQRVGWREGLPPPQLIRGNSVPALGGGKSSLLVVKELSAFELGFEPLLWHVFLAGPKQAQTQQPPLIYGAGLKDGIQSTSPENRKSQCSLCASCHELQPCVLQPRMGGPRAGNSLAAWAACFACWQEHTLAPVIALIKQLKKDASQTF